MLLSEIHHQICQVYDDNAMSDGVVSKGFRMFNEGRENVYDEARSGRPSLVNDIIIIFIYCNWVLTRWQWLFYM